jgi:hypothetical protein
MPNLKLPSLTLPTGGSLTDYNQLIGDMPAKTKAASEAKVTEVQKKYDDMDKPGFDIREEKFGKREAGLGKDIAINRALGIISTGLGVAGSKERSIAGALGNEGRQGIRDLIQGEAANRAAKDRLDDARDNFEQQKVAAKKGNYQAAETAGNRAADDLRASTQLTMTGAHYGNTEANQRLQLDQQGVISKAQLEQQGILGLGQIQATNAATNAQLKLGYAKLGVIKGQIAAGNDRAKAALANAEQKAYTAFRQDPETQKLYKNLEVKFGSNYMQNPQAQAQIQQATKMYMANAVPSLLGAEGGGGIPSFNDLQKAME